MRYLIASDIDRTLIKNSESDISNDTKNIINKLRSNNNLFVIASGRPLNNIKRLFKDYCDYIIGSNGAIVYDCKYDSVIYKDYIDKNRVNDIIRIVGNSYKKICFCSEEGWNIKANYKYQLRYIEERLIDDLNISFEVLKMEIYYDNVKDLNEFYNKLKMYNDLDVFKIVKGKDIGGYIEVINYGNDKYNAIKLLLEKENILNDYLITFGDNNNDLLMIRNAKYGVAVSDASDDVLSVSKYITKSCKEDGVFYFLNNNFDLEKNKVIFQSKSMQ